MISIKKIFAKYNDRTITVYQAYNDEIADEILKLGKFGPSYKLDRMTWIKPSFLWMMYRSGWATKKGQERIMSIEMYIEGFNEIISKAILSTYKQDIYNSQSEWKNKLKSSDVRCQWDPDRDIYGAPICRKAVQLGIRGRIVDKYINEYIFTISDISEKVYRWANQVKEGTFGLKELPVEKEYLVNENTKRILDM